MIELYVQLLSQVAVAAELLGIASAVERCSRPSVPGSRTPRRNCIVRTALLSASLEPSVHAAKWEWYT